MKSLEQTGALFRLVRSDPAGFAEKLFGFTPSADQRRMIEAPYRHNRTAIGSGHMTGKTKTVSIDPILWMLSHYPAYAIIIGESWSAVEDKIFPSIRAELVRANARARAQEIPEWEAVLELTSEKQLPLSSSWKIADQYACIGASPDRSEAIQGWHSAGPLGGTLVDCDEASHLSDELMPAILSYTVDPRNAVVLRGNPTRQDGAFSDILRGDPRYRGWHVETISSENSPNAGTFRNRIERGEITREEACNGKLAVPVPGLATYAWCAEMEETHGRISNFFESRVLGRPPEQSDETFISRRTIRECAGRWGRLDEPVIGHDEVLCVDPAWSDMGDEMTFIGVTPDIKPGLDAVTLTEAHRGMKELETITRLVAIHRERRLREIRVEMDGIGAPLTRLLLAHRSSSEESLPPIVGIQTGGGAHDKVGYANRRAENWDAMKRGLSRLAINPESVSKFYEVSNLRWGSPAGGQLLIEAKSAYRSRGHPSPNHADGLALFYARPVGDPLFAKVEDKRAALKMKVRPEVRMRGGKAEIYFPHWGPEVYARSGFLMRAMWWSRRTQSAVMWVHVDGAGAWTVFEAHALDGATLADFCLWTFHHSRGHEYRVDVCGATEASAKVGAEDQYHDVIRAELTRLAKDRNERAQIPWPIPESDVTGTAGLDRLDRLIQASPSAGGPMLAIWPSSVVEDLARARFRQSSKDAQLGEDAPEDAYGGGGALVRCLRMLALYSV